MAEQLKITVKPDSTVEMEVIGAQGQNCLLLTKDIEAKLGGRVKHDYKPEFYESDVVTNQQVQN